jgi:hypothetical protein
MGRIMAVDVKDAAVWCNGRDICVAEIVTLTFQHWNPALSGSSVPQTVRENYEL